MPNPPTHNKFDLWIPLTLLVLPVFMMILPLVFEVSPRRGLYYTPTVTRVYLVLVLLHLIVFGRSQWTRPTVPIFILVPVATLIGIAVYTSLFMASNSAYSIEKILDLATIIAIGIFGGKFIANAGEMFAQRLLSALFYSVVIAVPILAMLFFFQLPANNLWPNFLPGFIFVRVYGFSLTAAIAIGTGLLALPKTDLWSQKSIVFAGLVVLWSALFWSSSRAGVLSLLLVSAGFFIAMSTMRKPVLLMVLAMVIGALISTQFSVPSSAYGFFNVFEESTASASANQISGGRLGMWQEYLHIINQKPFWGHGYAQTTLVVDPASRIHAHTHNIVIEAALAWGWVGALCAAYLVVVFWIKGIRSVWKAQSGTKIAAFLLLSVFALYAWLDGIYFYYQSLLPIGFCIAVLSAKRKSET